MGNEGVDRLQVHSMQGGIRSPSYIGPREQTVTCNNGYSFAHKCFTRKRARPLEIDD